MSILITLHEVKCLFGFYRSLKWLLTVLKLQFGKSERSTVTMLPNGVTKYLGLENVHTLYGKHNQVRH